MRLVLSVYQYALVSQSQKDKTYTFLRTKKILHEFNKTVMLRCSGNRYTVCLQ